MLLAKRKYDASALRVYYFEKLIKFNYNNIAMTLRYDRNSTKN